MDAPAAVVFRASALDQLVRGQAWYEARREGLGADFAKSVEAAVLWIAQNPNAAPVVYEDVRRVVIKRFPYPIFYLATSERVVVLSCLHTRRNPSSWP